MHDGSVVARKDSQPLVLFDFNVLTTHPCLFFTSLSVILGRWTVVGKLAVSARLVLPSRDWLVIIRLTYAKMDWSCLMQDRDKPGCSLNSSSGTNRLVSNMHDSMGSEFKLVGCSVPCANRGEMFRFLLSCAGQVEDAGAHGTDLPAAEEGRTGPSGALGPGARSPCLLVAASSQAPAETTTFS